MTRKKAIAIRHVPFEDLDALEDVFPAAGFELVYMDATSLSNDVAELNKADLVIFLGGPIGVYQSELFPFLQIEIDLARSRLMQQKPVLGICLGAQIIAAALGAAVYPGAAGKEIGWSCLQLTEVGAASALRFLDGSSQPVLHWHGDTFDLPVGAQLLASSEQYKNQVFSVGQHCLAFQCHIEVSVAGLERWYVGHVGELLGIDPGCISRLRLEGQRYGPGLEGVGRNIAQTWLEALPSIEFAS